MSRLRNMDVIIYLSLALLIQILSIYINNALVFGSSVSSIDVFINSYGIANIILYIDLNVGLNNITLPVMPIETSIGVDCGGYEPPFIYENGVLYIASDRSCSAMISYIANVSYSNNIFTLDIATPYRVVLTIPRNILLISMPSNIRSVEEKDNNTIITFLGPSTIMYTVLSTTTSPVITMPTTITQTVIPTTPTSIPIETQTSVSTSIQTTSLSISTTSMPTIETRTTQATSSTTSLVTTTMLTTTIVQSTTSPQTSIQQTSTSTSSPAATSVISSQMPIQSTSTSITPSITQTYEVTTSLLQHYSMLLLIAIIIIVIAVIIVFILKK